MSKFFRPTDLLEMQELRLTVTFTFSIDFWILHRLLVLLLRSLFVSATILIFRALLTWSILGCYGSGERLRQRPRNHLYLFLRTFTQPMPERESICATPEILRLGGEVP